jgi:STE24 endopeptidase
MPLLPVLLVAIVLAVDEGLRPVGADWGVSRAWVLTIAWAPVLIALMCCMLVVRRSVRKMNRGDGPDSIFTAERFIRYTRWFLVTNQAIAVLVFGWLGVVRSVTGDLVLVDELIAIMPPLVGLFGSWWAYYPVEDRLREALLIRNLDEGRAVYPNLSRGAYVLLQVRLHVLLMLVPILMIVSLREMIEFGAAAIGSNQSHQWIQDLSIVAMAVTVFAVSPLMARWLLDVRPIAAGPLRDSLREVCDQHKVKTRELLLWNTNGTMFNAAVMGLIGPLRYVMITDALLESLPEAQVRAVMAHEIGHVRRHHMPWLVVCLLSSFVIASAIVIGPLYGLDRTGLIESEAAFHWIAMGTTVVQLVLGLLIFGWISRRFERQADTFAVQHLSRPATSLSPATAATAVAATQPATANVGGNVVQPEAVAAMCDALEAIARLNTIDIHRPSWRHGSIAWRMDYLDSLIGRPVAKLPIDRAVRWIKWSAAAILIGAIAIDTVMAIQSRNDAHAKPASGIAQRQLISR